MAKIIVQFGPLNFELQENKLPNLTLLKLKTRIVEFINAPYLKDGPYPLVQMDQISIMPSNDDVSYEGILKGDTKTLKKASLVYKNLKNIENIHVWVHLISEVDLKNGLCVPAVSSVRGVGGGADVLDFHTSGRRTDSGEGPSGHSEPAPADLPDFLRAPVRSLEVSALDSSAGDIGDSVLAPEQSEILGTPPRPGRDSQLPDIPGSADSVRSVGFETHESPTKPVTGVLALFGGKGVGKGHKVSKETVKGCEERTTSRVTIKKDEGGLDTMGKKGNKRPGVPDQVQTGDNVDVADAADVANEVDAVDAVDAARVATVAAIGTELVGASAGAAAGNDVVVAEAARIEAAAAEEARIQAAADAARIEAAAAEEARIEAACLEAAVAAQAIRIQVAAAAEVGRFQVARIEAAAADAAPALKNSDETDVSEDDGSKFQPHAGSPSGSSVVNNAQGSNVLRNRRGSASRLDQPLDSESSCVDAIVLKPRPAFKKKDAAAFAVGSVFLTTGVLGAYFAKAIPFFLYQTCKVSLKTAIATASWILPVSVAIALIGAALMLLAVIHARANVNNVSMGTQALSMATFGLYGRSGVKSNEGLDKNAAALNEPLLPGSNGADDEAEEEVFEHESAASAS